MHAEDCQCILNDLSLGKQPYITSSRFHYLVIVSIIVGLQCTQRALLSSSLHALQVYDDREYYLL